MSRVFIAAVAALCIPAAGYAQTSQQCATVTEEQVAGLFRPLECFASDAGTPMRW